MQSATAALYMVVLSVLLGSSSDVRAGENFVLLVNTVTGHTALRSDYPSTVWINQYSITSAGGSLNPLTWISLEDQFITGWDEKSASTTLVSESFTSGQASFQPGTGFNLGTPLQIGDPQDLVFQYRLAGSATPSLGVVSYTTSPITPPSHPVQVPMPCPGDINASGAVNVDDLLAVIGAWGSCAAPPTACPANIVNTGTSANRVDVDDLLAVISAWGPCL